MDFNTFNFRRATLNDIPFLVETIIEGEKSGTKTLSYSKIFDISEKEVRKVLSNVLREEVDNTELSVSSFLLAERGSKIAAATSAWVEGIDGIPSTLIKGNLLRFSLPKESIVKSIQVSQLIREISVEYIPNTIQIGSGYVHPEFRGNNLLYILTNQIISNIKETNPGINVAFVQIFSSNKPSIKTYERVGFKILKIVETHNNDILQYVPFNKKILMKKEL
jgi:ribosomal protein S18 acetylase RimI-like enzyme